MQHTYSLKPGCSWLVSVPGERKQVQLLDRVQLHLQPRRSKRGMDPRLLEEKGGPVVCVRAEEESGWVGENKAAAGVYNYI